MGSRVGGALAIEGGRPALARPLDFYYGASFLDEEEKAAVLEVLESKSLYRNYGPNFLGKVAAFETAFADYMGTRFALACSSGTAALRLGLIGSGVGPGDEVILPAVTFIASAGAVVAQGAVPVFAEVDRHFTLDPDDVASKITSRTKALMPVHLFGVGCDMDRLGEVARDHGLRVVEDTAQACGASLGSSKLGSIGTVGAFSFQLEKHITCGEGGALVTNDRDAWAMAARYHDQGGLVTLRRGGQRASDAGRPIMGENLRMVEISGAILGCQLRKLDRIRARARRALALVRQGCRDLKVEWLADDPARASDATAVSLLAPDDTTARVAVEALREEGLPAMRIYGGKPVYASDQLRHLRRYGDRDTIEATSRRGETPRYERGLCPRSEDLVARSVAVSIGPAFSDADLEGIVHGIRKVVNAYL